MKVELKHGDRLDLFDVSQPPFQVFRRQPLKPLKLLSADFNRRTRTRFPEIETPADSKWKKTH